MVDGVWVPITFFLMVVAIVAIVSFSNTMRARFTGGGNYQKLAEEAVRGQRVLLDEMQRMNQTLKEIERLLREV